MMVAYYGQKHEYRIRTMMTIRQDVSNVTQIRQKCCSKTKKIIILVPKRKIFCVPKRNILKLIHYFSVD